MKRKNADYKQPENSSSTLQEPVVNYHPNHNKIDNQHFAFISEPTVKTLAAEPSIGISLLTMIT